MPAGSAAPALRPFPIPGRADMLTMAVIVAIIATAARSPAQDFLTVNVPALPVTTAAVAGDFDQSGADDLLVLFSMPSIFAPTTVVGIYADPGRSPMTTLGASAPAPMIVAAQLPGVVSVRRMHRARLNGDAAPDLIVEAIRNNGQITIFGCINSGTGNFGTGTVIINVPSNIGSNYATAVGDFNADGVDELLMIAPQFLQLLDASGSVLFSETSIALSIAQRAFVGDWNGDGADDALIDTSFPVTANARFARLFAGQPNGAFGSTTVTAVDFFAPNASATIAAVDDVDGDGCDDLVTMPITPAAATPPTIRFGSSAGIIPVGTPILGAFPTLPIAPKIDLVDLDGDLFPELVGLDAANGPPATSPVMLDVARIESFFNPVAIGVMQVPLSGTIVTDYLGSNINLLEPATRAFGDFDGDGDRDLILVRSVTSSNFSSGFALVENRSIYGSGCPGPFGVPRLTSLRPSITNTNFQIAVVSASPSRFGVLAVSTAPQAGTPCLLIDTSPQNLLLVNGSPFVFATNAAGSFTLSVDLTLFPSIAGSRVYMEAFILDPAASATLFGLTVATSAGRCIDFY